MSDWRRVFVCDLRALALFRMLLGGAALVQVVGPAGDQLGTGSQWLGAAAARLFFLGYRTRFTATLIWMCLLAVALQSPGPLSEHIRLLLALSLLAIFLPLGACYSMDVSMDPEPADVSIVGSIGTLALTGQVVWIFCSAALSWWLPPDQGIADGVGFDSASAGVALVGLTGLLPVALFDRLGLWAAHRGGVNIYFDRDCGFCRKSCLLFRTFLLLGNTKILPVQDNPEAFEIMQKYNTWVVLDSDGTSYL